ncbi:MAG: phosphoenolpyruvate synthase [Flavobacteriales bacterium]|nr:phosphoenolpyruvate synthase [Flavobacteriales bacterium]MBP7515201.1 phosphoenolpyruvate synthase [Flavobacteriales bacterium]
MKNIRWLRDVRNTDVSAVGGKNASLGEMIATLGSAGISVPDGFAITSQVYWRFLDANGIREPLTACMARLDRGTLSNLKVIADEARALVLKAKWPEDLGNEVRMAYRALSGEGASVAVRSSATAEDLPTASFAGRHESFLNIQGEDALLDAAIRCYASLFMERAIKYRQDMGFPDMKVALSIGVQHMVRSDIGGAGVMFTLEPESGFRNVVHVAANWGLGENVVQGAVETDEYQVFKPTLREGKRAILQRKLGAKQKTMVLEPAGDGRPGSSTVNLDTPAEQRERFVLSDEEVNQLARWAITIEDHYGMPMDIEWAKDGNTGKLYIVQARPETVHSAKDPFQLKEFALTEQGKVLVTGSAVGSGIAAGRVRKLGSPAQAHLLQPGEVLVTDITNPDWDPVLKRASAIVTNKGGRTSHAAIVAREMGTVAVVGALNATEVLQDGQLITVSCAEGRTGKIHEGHLKWTETSIDLKSVTLPRTDAMLILADPEKAFRFSFYPNRGVGLMRLEFVINNTIRVHPMALVKFNELKDEKAKAEIEQLTRHHPDKPRYFIGHLAEAVATIAAAFHPHDVIVRMSDFKTNEYASLLGGAQFEPKEENPMIGFRGASRYYNERYREGFRLECEAMKLVRNEMGLTNVKLMIPFCRTVSEAKRVTELMAEFGLKRGEEGLQLYMMTEIPSNVIRAKDFARYFDGFSIGSNDLTQLTLGIDRDSAIISDLFNESDAAVTDMIAFVIASAHATGTRIGLCGQGPSDDPGFARFLVEQGIDSISFNPDALVNGIRNIREAERTLKVGTAFSQ